VKAFLLNGRLFVGRGDKGSPEHLARITARRAARRARAS